MPEEVFPSSLQESLLALLAFDNKHGTVVALKIEVKHFSEFYQKIAAPILAYRRQYGRPPGQAHLDDLYAEALSQGEQAPRLRRIVVGLGELSKGINPAYLVDRVDDFIRSQGLKSAVMRVAELYGSGTAPIAQVEEVLYAALRTRPMGLEPALRLNDTERSLTFLDFKPVDIPIGIEAMDKAGFGASRKEMLLYIAPVGTGKTWFSVYQGIQGLIHREKVLHLSLEWIKEKVAGRYYQSCFGMATNDASYLRTSLEYDEFKHLLGWSSKTTRPKVTFRDPDIRKTIREKVKPWGLRMGSIVIQDFPSGSLTMAKFNTYLDHLESVEKFIPTMVIVDSPDLMKHDPNNLRISLGQTFVGLRGSAQERNYALVATTQGGRSSIGAKRVRTTNVSEDISKVQTADNVLTYSQTEAEKRDKLARLFVNKARGGEDGYEVIISQAYAIGQYVLESARMTSSYWEKLRQSDGETYDVDE